MQRWIWSRGTYIHSQGWRSSLGHQLWVWFGQGCVGLDSQGLCYVNLDYSHLNPMFPHMWGPPLTLVKNAFVPYIPIFCPLPPSHPYLIITLYATKTRLVCTLKTITCPRFLSLTCSLSVYGWRFSIHVGIFLTTWVGYLYAHYMTLWATLFWCFSTHKNPQHRQGFNMHNTDIW